MDITGILVLTYNLRNSFLFTITCKTSLPAICVSAVNLVCEVIDIVRKCITSLKQILCYSVAFFNQHICVFQW